MLPPRRVLILATMVLIEVFAVFHFFSMDFSNFENRSRNLFIYTSEQKKNIFQMLRVRVAHKPSGSQELQLARAGVDKPQVSCFYYICHMGHVERKARH